MKYQSESVMLWGRDFHTGKWLPCSFSVSIHDHQRFVNLFNSLQSDNDYGWVITFVPIRPTSKEQLLEMANEILQHGQIALRFLGKSKDGIESYITATMSDYSARVIRVDWEVLGKINKPPIQITKESQKELESLKKRIEEQSSAIPPLVAKQAQKWLTGSSDTIPKLIMTTLEKYYIIEQRENLYFLVDKRDKIQ
jgi:hypothetical protein